MTDQEELDKAYANFRAQFPEKGPTLRDFIVKQIVAVGKTENFNPSMERFVQGIQEYIDWRLK